MTEPTAAELNESAMNNLSRGNGVEAARQLQWALIAKPDYAEAWANRAVVLRSLNDPFDAILCLERAIELDPCSEYYNTLGVCWATMGQLEKARGYYDKALALRSDFPEALHNKASAAKLSGYGREAIELYAKAVKLRPDNPDYHLSYAAALLARGRLKEGWREYNWRHKASDAFLRHVPLPDFGNSVYRMDFDERGNGELAVKGKGVLLYAEQGFGDAIQFVRYAPILREKYGCKVYIEVKKPMVLLCRSMAGIDGVLAYGDPIPEDCEFALSMMDAPIYAATDTISDIPAQVPYFTVVGSQYFNNPVQAAAGDNLRVGLCWHSGIRPYQPELREFAERKSIAAQFLQPLAKLEGVRWFSLQLPAGEMPFEGIVDLTANVHDFYDTAQLMRALDLVVSVDTSVAHLAGALGVPTYVMTPADNCWRWMGDRPDSPWYPSVTQFRQSAPGDWPSVIERVSRAIEERYAQK